MLYRVTLAQMQHITLLHSIITSPPLKQQTLLPPPRSSNTIRHIISFVSSKYFEKQTYRQVRRQDQISTLADIIPSMANDLRFGSWDISYSFSVIWVTEDDDYEKR